MRFRSRHSAAVADGDMTPMIDMAFQLIAFFMVVINFAGANQDERIHLPLSELAKPPEAPFELPITLQLDAQGMVIVAGEMIPVARVKPLLRREREFIEYRGGKPSEATIIIRADARARTGLVQELIKACQDTGYEKFAVAAKQQEED
ncbi:MAG: biopolymer transporter ExbD [Pirellulales bacterium]|nr:biopolymer transporter ExbD [Pirellulales bacterium]